MEKLCHSYGQRLEELLTTYGEKVKSYGQHMEELSRRYGDTFKSYGEIQKPYGEALEKVLQIVKNSGEMSNGYGETVEIPVVGGVHQQHLYAKLTCGNILPLFTWRCQNQRSSILIFLWHLNNNQIVNPALTRRSENDNPA